MHLKKYIIDSKMFEYDKHYRDCVQSAQPFIKAKINPIHGKYHVQIDLMPCNYKFSKEGLDNLKSLFENEIKHKSNTLKTKLPPYSIQDEISWVNGVSPLRLNEFCELLYEFSQKYHE